jgi:hypothetical protein
MKKILEISNLFKLERLKNDQRIVIFLVCLLIATILWFLNALSKNYTATLPYSVKYSNPPEKLFLSNNPPSRLNLEVEAHGFTLLRQKLSFSLSPINFNLDDIKNSEPSSNNRVLLQRENLIRRISSQVSNDISVLNVNPGNLELIFDSLKSKNVPVITDINVQFKTQFFLNGEIRINPNIVQITGPASKIDTIQSIKSQRQNYEELDSSIEELISLKPPDNVKVDPKKVTLNIPVERFTEKKLTVPILVINKPKGSNLKIFPSVAEISFLVGLSNYEGITSNDFKAIAIYDSTQNQQTLNIVIENSPKYIQQLRVSPPNVEYLIEADE